MPERRIEDLTLKQLAEMFLRQPARTWRAWTAYMAGAELDSAAVVTVDAQQTPESRFRLSLRSITLARLQLLLFALAILVGLRGNMILRGAEHRPPEDAIELEIGAPYIWLALMIWLLGELAGHWDGMRLWWRGIDRFARYCCVARLLPAALWCSALFPLAHAMSASGDTVLPLLSDVASRSALGLLTWWLIDLACGKYKSKGQSRSTVLDRLRAYPHKALGVVRRLFHSTLSWEIRLTRVMVFAGAMATSLSVWANTANNVFAPSVIVTWLLSGALWAWTFAPANWSFVGWLATIRCVLQRIRFYRFGWAAVGLTAVLIAGAVFRLAQLDTLPREMYPDHADAIFDAYRIWHGEFEIMTAPHHDAREPLHYYLMALFSNLPGLGFDHFTLKLVAAIESILTLPLLVWAGAEVMGERNRKFGIAVGLLAGALVAVSYWHVVISRYALRTHLTVPFAALLIICMGRALRNNRRADFVVCGLVLGFSMYAYTASRMLPLVVLSGLATTLLIRRTTWRERLEYLVNLAALVFVSLMIFLPMLRYAQDDPQHFWGQIAIHTSGSKSIESDTSDIFNLENLALLLNNMRNALASFYWQGDADWIHAVNREPALDVYTSTFFLLGVAALAIRLLKRRDPAQWMFPAAAICMLLPSALAFYLPWVNPDNTRMSGAIPAVYIVAALPMAVIAFALAKQVSGRIGKLVAGVFCVAAVSLSAQQNWEVYFYDFAHGYAATSQPYSELGAALRGFNDSDGSYANAFAIGWGFNRPIAIETRADPKVAQRNIRLQDVPKYMRSSLTKTEPHRFDAGTDLLFMYKTADDETADTLAKWFPYGRETQRIAYDGKPYSLFRVPALGETGLRKFLQSNS